ncbi:MULTISPECIES: methyltransferase, FxLD system [unclassified Micromonospora]|uniref:methyltransferase, FxLD system n=1 Tax=unclassified Micromonospora TaxID=2617518 RepID=UPI001C241CCB|nr:MULTISPECIES: methyltransferase, FxLD system [unclassified Micromonospora]MBU8857698.1 methyltransferase, FxLD system [Micromonospora sp. WMMB482]MDM4783325.1 methyltransferase, FxLD system [Micromonospora sp. b486]
MDLDPEPDAERPSGAGPVSRWRQVNLTFTSWRTAEEYAATRLAPALTVAEDDGAIAAFWFIRKAETWRLRLLPGSRLALVYALLADITADDRIRDVAEPIYGPEAYAFGGDQAMTIAHTFFHADSRHVLGHLADGGDHRRELGVLLATRLMRAAGLEFSEQGDVWRHIVTRRHQTHAPTPSPGLIAAVQRLVTAGDDTPRSPLSVNPSWPEAHEQTGRDLRFLDRHGTLTRDLRGVLTHHVLFLFNRLGISATDTWLLATAAVHVTFHASDISPGDRCAGITDSRVKAVKTSQNGSEGSHAAALREQLVTILKQRGHIRSAPVEQAFRTVPREQFLPGVDLETVYTRRQIVTKRDPNGAALSSASSPSLVADMLEQLDPQPGDHVLELGAATGINAALLAELTNPGGTVTTIELDQDLADGARAGLDRAGYHTVEVICGDGALGHPESAPYDRAIITAGAWDITAAWWDQLAEHGRIVLPLRVHESGLTRCFAFDRTGPTTLVSTTTPLVCGFVPLRGTAEHTDQHVRLDSDVVLKLDAGDKPDRAALARALSHPRYERWTGIQVTDDDAIGHLDLWLLIHTSTPFGRLRVGDTARASGLVAPAYRWAGAAIYHGSTIAYLAFRETGDRRLEIGAIAYGPDADNLAVELTDLLGQWDEAGRPNQPTVTAHRAGTRPVRTGDISWPDTVFALSF